MAGWRKGPSYGPVLRFPASPTVYPDVKLDESRMSALSMLRRVVISLTGPHFSGWVGAGAASHWVRSAVTGANTYPLLSAGRLLIEAVLCRSFCGQEILQADLRVGSEWSVERSWS